VRGDTEFSRDALPRLENHSNRPEVRAAYDSARGVGMNQRLRASTNERQLYVAVRDGPPGIAITRVSTTLAVVDAQVHAVQRAVGDGVAAAEQRGALVSANAAARRLLAYGSTQALPPLGEVFHDRPHRTLMREVLAGGVVERRELDLGDRTVVVSARPLAEGGTLLLLSDVTDLRRLETIRRDFVANVSHELKTPLTAIAGYAETLAAEASDQQATGFAQTIVEN